MSRPEDECQQIHLLVLEDEVDSHLLRGLCCRGFWHGIIRQRWPAGIFLIVPLIVHNGWDSFYRMFVDDGKVKSNAEVFGYGRYKVVDKKREGREVE